MILDNIQISNQSTFQVDTRPPKQPKSHKRDLRTREEISTFQLKRSLSSIFTALNLPLSLIEQCLEITTAYMNQTSKPLGPMGRLQLAMGYVYVKCKVSAIPLTLTQLSQYSQVPPTKVLACHQELILQFPNLQQNVIASPVIFFERQLAAIGQPLFGPIRDLAMELFGVCEHLTTGRKPDSFSFALVLVSLECTEQRRFSVQQLQEKCTTGGVLFTAVYDRYREIKQHLLGISKLPFAVTKDTVHMHLPQIIQLSHLYPMNTRSLPPAFLQAQLDTKDKQERIERARHRIQQHTTEGLEDETDLFIEELIHQGLSDDDILNYLPN